MRDLPLIEPVTDDAELDNLHDVLDSGYLTQGPYTEEFERTLARRVDADHAVATTSCTTGMELALDALDVGPGDEVIVPDFTYPATATAVVRVGAEPVLVDVDRRTYTLDPEAAADAVTDDTAALLPVSWGGQPLDPAPLKRLAESHDAYVVEDAACALGARYEDQAVGSQFTASVFSFHPRKVVTTGEGGAVTTDDDELEAAMRQIKNFGTNPRTDVGFVRADATNFRMSNLLAAVGVAQLDKQEELLSRRRELAATYDELLADLEGVRAPVALEGGHHTYQTYGAFVEAGDDGLRDDLIDALDEADIETQIGTHALHRTEAFRDAKRVGSLEGSAALAENVLALPMAHSMTQADQERVVDTLAEKIDLLA